MHFSAKRHAKQADQKILKQTAKQCVFILVPCVDCPRGDTGFVSDLAKRGFLKAVGKKLRVCSLNDPVLQGVIPIGYVSASRSAITSFLITV